MNTSRRKPLVQIQSETSLQMQCAGLLDKHLASPAVYTAFPAGGGGEMRGKILKGMGLKAGFPDLMIMWGGMGARASSFAGWLPGSGIYLVELKTIRGVVSNAQRDMHAAIRATLPGAEIAICRTLDEFKVQLDAWDLPRRELSGNQQKFADAFAKLAITIEEETR